MTAGTEPGPRVHPEVLEAADCKLMFDVNNAYVNATNFGHDVREAIEGVGATIRYLPPYSPDFNPIEMVFSKLKALLKKAAHRTVEALWNEIGTLLDAFSPQECANYFKSCGYEPE